LNNGRRPSIRSATRQQQIDAARVRGCVGRRELAGAGHPQSAQHRRDRDRGAGGGERNFGPAFEYREHHVIAALRCQRHPRAEPGGEPAGPCARCQHHRTHLVSAGVGQHRAHSAVGQCEVAHALAADRAAAAQEMLGQTLREELGVCRLRRVPRV
jgi:hypothetical protein